MRALSRFWLCIISVTLVVACANAQCGLPPESLIEDNLLPNVLKNAGGEDPSVTVVISKYHYTCQAIYAYNKYREMSLIIEYTKDGTSDILYSQIQINCESTGGDSYDWDYKNEITHRSNDDLFSLTTRVNCLECSKDISDNSHCTGNASSYNNSNNNNNNNNKNNNNNICFLPRFVLFFLCFYYFCFYYC